jgi:putative transposase
MKADRDAKLRDPVFGIFDDNEGAYGRRRIHDEIGIIVGKCRIAFGSKSYKKNKRYDSYKKEIFEHPNNKVKQDFAAGLPNFLVALRRHAL